MVTLLKDIYIRIFQNIVGGEKKDEATSKIFEDLHLYVTIVTHEHFYWYTHEVNKRYFVSIIIVGMF